jgi:hypothetical protein
MKSALAKLSLILLAAIVGLGSCDAILNAVYPEFDPENGSGGLGSNMVHVNIDLAEGINMTGPVIVSLVPMRQEGSQWILKLDQAWKQDFWALGHIEYDFRGLSNGAYRVFVWVDNNNNRNPEPDEASALVLGVGQYGQTFEMFDFRTSQGNMRLDGSVWMMNETRMPYEWLTKFNQGTSITD